MQNAQSSVDKHWRSAVGYGFKTQRCSDAAHARMHSAESPARRGAPGEEVRDGLQDVVAHGGQVGLEVAAGHVGAAHQQHMRLVL